MVSFMPANLEIPPFEAPLERRGGYQVSAFIAMNAELRRRLRPPPTFAEQVELARRWAASDAHAQRGAT